MPGESQQAPDTAPDPTVLVTEAIERQARHDRDYLTAQLTVFVEKFHTVTQRLDGIDKATDVLHETITRRPTEVELAIAQLKELMAVELGAVAQQFRERDTRSERESRDNKVAVDAAFAAQKEAAAKQDEANQKAIDKSEKATTETINKLNELFKTTTDALADKIDDNKARIAAQDGVVSGIQARSGGVRDQRTEQRASSGALYATIGFGLSLAIAAITIVGVLVANGTP